LRRAKIIFTISESKITEGKKGEILSQFEQVTKLFCNLDFLKSSLYLVITKGTEFIQKEDIEDIEINLQNLIDLEDQPNQNQSIEEIIATLIENKRIGLFPKPNREGPIEQVVFREILSDLNHVPESEIGAVNLEISASAKVFINGTFIKMNACVASRLRDISEKIISQLCNRKVDIAKDLTEVRKFCGLLLNKVPLAFSLNDHSKLGILNEVVNYADKIIEVSNRNGIIELVEDCQKLKRYVHYIEKLLELFPENTLDSDNWNQEVQNLRRQIVDILRVSDEINGNTIIFRGILISVAQIKAKIMARSQINWNRLEIYCLNTFFLDEDLIFPGVDVLITAPTWVMYTAAEINLSGKDQAEVPQVNENKDGKPGLPGGNSGNFVGICQTFVGQRLLRMRLRGGKGGQGSGGKDGKVGDAGADGDLEKVKNRDPSLMISKEILYRPTSVVYSMLTWNATFSEVYESRGKCGKRGEDGGRGGSGGIGGKGGYALLLIGQEAWELDHKRLQTGDGERGQNGASGNGGQGGNGGKSYVARYFNDIVLPEFRDQDYWRSRRTAKKIMNAPRTVSRGILHAGMIATHVTLPAFLPAIALVQLGVSFHLSNINSHWKEPPEGCFELEKEGKCGKTPQEKNSHGLVGPRSSNFDINHEKTILIQNYINYNADIQQNDKLKSLIKNIVF